MECVLPCCFVWASALRSAAASDRLCIVFSELIPPKAGPSAMAPRPSLRNQILLRHPMPAVLPGLPVLPVCIGNVKPQFGEGNCYLLSPDGPIRYSDIRNQLCGTHSLVLRHGVVGRRFFAS